MAHTVPNSFSLEKKSEKTLRGSITKRRKYVQLSLGLLFRSSCRTGRTAWRRQYVEQDPRRMLARWVSSQSSDCCSFARFSICNWGRMREPHKFACILSRSPSTCIRAGLRSSDAQRLGCKTNDNADTGILSPQAILRSRSYLCCILHKYPSAFAKHDAAGIPRVWPVSCSVAKIEITHCAQSQTVRDPLSACCLLLHFVFLAPAKLYTSTTPFVILSDCIFLECIYLGQIPRLPAAWAGGPTPRRKCFTHRPTRLSSLSRS
jgi:hypothetical protein